MNSAFKLLILIFSLIALSRTASISSLLNLHGRFSRNLRSNTIYGRSSQEPNPHYLFMKIKPPKHLSVDLHDNRVLECEAGGSPPPTIHWLKDGRTIATNVNNDENAISEVYTPILGIGSTKSKLFIDCFGPQDEAEYTCVAETPYQREISKSKVVIKHVNPTQLNSLCVSTKKSIDTPARITMWTGNMLENMGNDVILFCRTLGKPNPKITWLANDELVDNNAKYQVQENGDLLVRHIDWNDMGEYTCVAENSVDRDSAETFLYPVKNEDD
uniref:Ig-like domain-containing protein n=1 Tax=Strigamia maritima TaxID=126957 RepID=T1J0Z2_STRMM